MREQGHQAHWWQRGIIYQIYPRSFMDSNGDGVGDLAGITSRLDYLCDLGVDAVWLSPVYPSPMADFGYDVSNYTDIHPLFGTLDDFDRLVAEAHARQLRVIMDFVPNHTSEEHPWFIESRSSRDNPKRDWYIWHDPAPDGGPPNNWLSAFGGSGWEWDEQTGQYYFHAFLKEQPDLDWRNPEVQAAMLDVLRFWLERGVDGFRLDAVWHVIKDDQFRDDPPNPDYQAGQNPYLRLLPLYSGDRPEVHQVIAMMRQVLDQYPETVLIGELYLPIERLVTYYGVGGSGCQLPANFQLIVQPWDADVIGMTIDAYEAALPVGGWPNWVIGNHDKHRVASRIGSEQARVAAMLLLTLRGTPTIYYGDEIGMHDIEIPPDKAQDPVEHNVPGLGLGRDPERTPMQWDGGPNAGFTAPDASPWLPLAPDYQTLNVESERDDPGSMLALYRRLIALRRAEPALEIGRYTPVPAGGAGASGDTRNDLIAYLREKPAEEVAQAEREHTSQVPQPSHAPEQRGAKPGRLLVVLNLSHEARRFVPPSRLELRGRVVLATHADREGEAIEGPIELRADEGLIARLD